MREMVGTDLAPLNVVGMMIVGCGRRSTGVPVHVASSRPTRVTKFGVTRSAGAWSSDRYRVGRSVDVNRASMVGAKVGSVGAVARGTQCLAHGCHGLSGHTLDRGSGGRVS